MREFYLDYYDPHKIERAIYRFRTEPPLERRDCVYVYFDELEPVLKEAWREGDRIYVGELRDKSDMEFLVKLFGKKNVREQ